MEDTDEQKRIEKGRQSEKKVDKALYFLKKQKQINDYIWASSIEILDKEGKDFLVISIRTSKYEVIPLQVKSSFKGMEEHKKKGKEKGIEIPVIVVAQKDTIYDLMRKIIKVLHLS